MNKKGVIGGVIATGLLIWALWPKAPKFSVELIDKLNKKIKHSFDGHINTTGEGESTTVAGRNNYVLVAQGDTNGVAFTLYQGDTLKKKLNVLYNQTDLPNKL